MNVVVNVINVMYFFVFLVGSVEYVRCFEALKRVKKAATKGKIKDRCTV